LVGELRHMTPALIVLGGDRRLRADRGGRRSGAETLPFFRCL